MPTMYEKSLKRKPENKGTNCYKLLNKIHQYWTQVTLDKLVCRLIFLNLINQETIKLLNGCNLHL